MRFFSLSCSVAFIAAVSSQAAAQAVCEKDALCAPCKHGFCYVSGAPPDCHMECLQTIRPTSNNIYDFSVKGMSKEELVKALKDLGK
jgi:hypothetical protein